MKDKFNITIYFFTFSIICILVVPSLIRDGMFMDTVQYSAISRNMSEGIGSFWYPQFDLYNIHNLNAFYEQPPIGIFLPSLLFELLGNSFWVERIYTLLTLIAAILIIHSLWNWLCKIKLIEGHHKSWFPILIWILTPIVFHNYQSNFIENSLTVFCLLAVFMLVKSYHRHFYIYTIIASTFILFGIFTKGLPALFPIIIPLISPIFNFTTFKKGFIQFAILTLLLASYIITILQYAPAKEWFDNYFLDRVLTRIESEVVVNNRFQIIFTIFIELLFPLLLSLLSYFIIYRKSIGNTYLGIGVFFILIGISASFPIAFTYIQKPFYLSPSMPYFAIGFGILNLSLLDMILNWAKRINLVFLVSGFTLLLITIFLIFKYHSVPLRSPDIIADIEKIHSVVPDYEIVFCPTEVYYNWNLHSNLIRKHTIRLDFNTERRFLIIDKSYSEIPDTSYSKIDLATSRFDLYELKKSYLE